MAFIGWNMHVIRLSVMGGDQGQVRVEEYSLYQKIIPTIPSSPCLPTDLLAPAQHLLVMRVEVSDWHHDAAKP